VPAGTALGSEGIGKPSSSSSVDATAAEASAGGFGRIAAAAGDESEAGEKGEGRAAAGSMHGTWRVLRNRELRST
jgi:hypothetical protein